MANIKKNFNFRNGVQVDDDNLLVTTTGLVGIGTTVPSEALDVRGNMNVTGFASITQANIGIITITSLDPNEIIGTGVSIKSGIITAAGSGIVTFFGDARFLQGMPTSQWEDVDVGLGYTSIFNTGGNVGVGTTDPRSTIQVGNNIDAGEKGVGISSAGNINASGIITATSFVGDLTGNIVSNTTISGNVDLNADIDVDGHTNLDNVSISGIATVNNLDVDGQTDLDILNVSETATFSSPIDLNSDLDVDGHTNLDNLSVSGVTTFSGSTTFNHNLTLNADIDIDGHANIDNLNVSGVTTFAQKIEGAATNNVIPFLYSSMSDLPSASTYHGAVAHVHATGSLYYAHANQWWELVHVETSGRVGTSTENYDLNYVGAATTVHTTKLGVGTTEAPVTDIQVRNSGTSKIQITSENASSLLSLGRETSTQNGNNAELRFGGGVGANYSSDHSFDIINYDKGNFNYHLSADSAGAVDGDYHWHRGINNATFMTLTGVGGSLGIGITTPATPLHVIGNSTFSGNVILGGDLDVSGNANMQVVGNVVGNLEGNVFAPTGVSTFFQLDLDTNNYYNFGEISASGVGIGISMEQFKLRILHAVGSEFTVSQSGNVGIKTDNVNGNAFFVNGDITGKNALTIGKNSADTCAIDFSNAGKDIDPSSPLANRSFMLPPKLSNSDRNSLTGVVAGAMIYNTSTNTLQVHNGTGWRNVTSTAV